MGRQSPIKDIRHPTSPPHLQAIVQNLAARLRSTPMAPLAEALAKVCYLQEEFNRSLAGRYNSAPAPHNPTHLPDSTLDPLPVGVPSGLANSNLEGTANAFVRRDHQHKRDVRVQVAGVDVATRNKVNFVSGAVVADNPGTDAADITIGGDLLQLVAFLPHQQRIPKVQAGSGISIVENALGPVITSSGGSPDSDQNILANQVFGVR